MSASIWRFVIIDFLSYLAGMIFIILLIYFKKGPVEETQQKLNDMIINPYLKYNFDPDDLYEDNDNNFDFNNDSKTRILFFPSLLYFSRVNN